MAKDMDSISISIMQKESANFVNLSRLGKKPKIPK